MSKLSEYYKSTDRTDELNILEELWEYSKTLEPHAVEGLSYGLPALKLNDHPLIGFAIAKNHMSLYPFNSKIIDSISDDLAEYEYSKGVIKFTKDKVITKELIELVINLRARQIKK